MKTTGALCSLFILIALFITPAFAEDKKKEEETKKEIASTPITEWIDAENKMVDSLPKGNQKVFFVMRNKHSVIRSIRVVHGDIKKAVTACGKENKDLKKPMADRLKDWEEVVFPILKDAEKFLKQELKEQEAFHISDYQHVMKLNDKAYEYSDSKIEKTPVTTPEACDKLLASMDQTEDKLIRLMQEILLPEAVVRKRAEMAKAREDKSTEKEAGQ
jgi:iron-sulfur cluster repair protein YtfE (RIC family)